MSKTTEIRSEKRFRSLAVTLTLAFLTLSVFVLLLSTSLELFLSYQTQREFIRNQQQLIAQSAAHEVSEFVEEKFRILDQAADLNNLATLPDRRDLVMNKLAGRDPSFRQLFLLNATGTELHKVTRLSSQIVNPLGTLREPILASALKGEKYISPVYIDENTSEPLMLLAIPARDIFREPKGVFVAEVNLKFLWDLVGNIEVGEGGVAYVVDNNGNLIAFRDISRVLARESLMHVSEVSEYVENSHAKEDEFEFSSIGIFGTRVVTSYIPLGTPDWAVIVELPIREAYATIMRIFFFSMLVVALSAILSLLCGMYISRRITRPIQSLTGSAERLAAGLLAERASVSSSDEIGQLALSFNTMAQKMQDLYTGMDQKIKEKTGELSNQVSEVEKSKSAILNLLEDIEEEKKRVDKLVIVRTQELNDEKARLLASINSLSFGFVLIDVADTIILKNPALGKILDLKSEPKTMHDIAAVFKNADSKIDIDISQTCKRCMELKEPVEFKEVPYGKRFLRIICSPIIGERVTIGYIFLVEDITEAKVMERSRDEFFAVASHELRTPLTAIRGNADMILSMYADKILDKDMKDMLTDINSSSVRLIDVVNDFLEVSRLEQGKIEFKNESFDVSELVTKVVRDLKEMISKRGLALTFTPPTTPLPKVFADRNRTEQVLVNLIGNSAKFTREGGVTVEIVPSGNMVKVLVVDTGVGISEHNQARLFRKFQQAGEDMLARDVTQSSGLGLYISHLLVEGMGGTIQLEKSELGKGSTFSFVLPNAT